MSETAPGARYVLRFFFDAGAGTCLWAANPAARERFDYAVDLEALALAPEWRERALALVARHATSIAMDDPAGPSPWSPAECEQFERDAAGLLAGLRAQLGPEFEVRDER